MAAAVFLSFAAAMIEASSRGVGVLGSPLALKDVPSGRPLVPVRPFVAIYCRGGDNPGGGRRNSRRCNLLSSKRQCYI